MSLPILGIIEEGLVLLNKLVPDQATHIANEIKSFKEKWDEEFSKKEKRDDNALDSIERELLDIRKLYSFAIVAAASKIIP